MMDVMFKSIAALSIAIFVFYEADQNFFDGRHVDGVVVLAQTIARSFGI